MTDAAWTNPETGKTLAVFVHDVIEVHGETFAIVNKGEARTPATFRVRLADTNVVLA